MTSTSQSGVSTITVYLRLNYDADKALTEINTKITSVLNQLPAGTQQPMLTVKVGQTIDAMYIGFNSKVLEPNQITDYLVRVVQPKLQAVPGVQTAEMLGGKNFALRAWLDPDKLAAYGLTAADVSQALAANNYISGVGTTKGQMVQVNLTASTDLHSLDAFRNLVVKQSGAAIVRLKDVANVTLGDDDYESQVGFDGQRAVYIGIQVAPAANLLDVIKGVRAVFPGIQAQLPQGLNGTIVYDSTDFVNSSIHEVVRTLVEAVLIVTLVVFVFLGSPRSVLIPVDRHPAVADRHLHDDAAVRLLHQSADLLALVLAIGLVVDDAIIVVENVNRHLEDGMRPIPAAIQAARELGGPIIAMTVVLIAVYVPIGFQGGLTGALFTEFAFTLVGAVTVSAIIALTLSPMMTSRLLRAHAPGARDWEARLVGLHRSPLRRAAPPLPALAARQPELPAGHRDLRADHPGQHLFLLQPTRRPSWRRRRIRAWSSPPPPRRRMRRCSSACCTTGRSTRTSPAFRKPTHVFQLDVPGPGHRRHGAEAVGPAHAHHRRCCSRMVQQALSGIAGQRIVAFQPPPLPGGIGLPVQFVIGTTEPFAQLNDVTQKFLHQAQRQRAVHLPRHRSAHRQAADRRWRSTAARRRCWA